MNESPPPQPLAATLQDTQQPAWDNTLEMQQHSHIFPLLESIYMSFLSKLETPYFTGLLWFNCLKQDWAEWGHFILPQPRTIYCLLSTKYDYLAHVVCAGLLVPSLPSRH